MKINFRCAKSLFKDTKVHKTTMGLDSIECKLPNGIMKLLESKSGIYKISPEQKVIDALSQITTKNGKPKFPEKVLKEEFRKVNMERCSGVGREQYADSRCSGIVKFAEREDVCLKDIVEYSLLPQDANHFIDGLTKERFEVFKEFMKYTRSGRQTYSLKETNPRRFSFKELLYISKNMPEEQIKILRELAKIKTAPNKLAPEGRFLFGGEELLRIVSSKNIDMPAFVNLSKNSGLDAHSILELTKVKDIDLNKTTKIVRQLRKSHNGNVALAVEKDVYEPNKLRLMEWSKSNDKEVLVKTFDEKMNQLSVDIISKVSGKNNQARIQGENFDVVIQSNTVTSKDNPQLKVKVISIVNETRYIKDSEGNLLRTEVLEPSKIKGLHNWYSIMPDGSKKPIISVKTNKNGILSVNKNLEALDGTLTKSKYQKLPDGSWVMRLNILKDGQFIAKRNIKHRMVSANEAESIVNGKHYKVLYSPDEICVLNNKGKVDCVINLDRLIDSCNTPQNAVKLKTMLKECSADELQVISKKLKGIEFNKESLQAYAGVEAGKISCADDIFIFRHELGHIDDLLGRVNSKTMSYEGIYSTSDKFKNVYSQESDMFMKEFPNTQRKYVDYFVNHSDIETSRQSFQETTAELLASNKSPNVSDIFGIRTEYLERYFPKTRSVLVNA